MDESESDCLCNGRLGNEEHSAEDGDTEVGAFKLRGIHDREVVCCFNSHLAIFNTVGHITIRHLG